MAHTSSHISMCNRYIHVIMQIVFMIFVDLKTGLETIYTKTAQTGRKFSYMLHIVRPVWKNINY